MPPPPTTQGAKPSRDVLKRLGPEVVAKIEHRARVVAKKWGPLPLPELTPDDVVQETLKRVEEKLPEDMLAEPLPVGRIVGWAAATALNYLIGCVRNPYRRLRRTNSNDERGEVGEDVASPSANFEDELNRRSVVALVRKTLTPQPLRVFELLYEKNMTREEVARALGFEVRNAVDQTVSRMVKKCALLLSDHADHQRLRTDKEPSNQSNKTESPPDAEPSGRAASPKKKGGSS